MPETPSEAVTSDRGPGERAPERIGRYRLLEPLGEGGFGVVWLAEQTEPVRRRVALKVIKPGMDSRAVIARFEAERQALAMMDHPCVARVLDGGTIGEGEPGAGRPYFVMELVKGLPITEHCDRHQLTIEERIELFIRVCEAIQHAHQKGVIHRDIKPSNVLVEYDDATGKASPKVIDFGVAKALSQQLTEATLFTERGQMIGTPEYMSPEQAENSPQGVDTRADVYSLGVMLYELLTGVRPFDLRKLALHEMQRVIREQDAPKPSTRLSTVLSSADDPETASRILKARRVDTRRLTSTLRRDLDWACLKCLEKDRERRYETAAAVGDDLERYLAGEPLEAGPPSVSYRVGKFVKRRRGTIAAAGAVVVVLLVGLAGTIVYAGRADAARMRAEEAEREQSRLVVEVEDQRDIAIEERERARRELERAGQLKEFLTSILTSIDPYLVRGRDTRLLEDLLVRAVERFESQAISDPLLEAELKATVADVYRSLGRLQIASTLYTDTVQIRERELGVLHETTLRAKMALVWTYYFLGEVDVGLQKARDLAVQYELAGIDGIKVRDAIARFLLQKGDVDKALPIMDEVRRVYAERHGSDRGTAVFFEAIYSQALYEAGRIDEADKLGRAALADMQRLWPNGPYTLNHEYYMLVREFEQNGDTDVLLKGVDVVRRMQSINGVTAGTSMGAAVNLALLLVDNKFVTDARDLLIGLGDAAPGLQTWDGPLRSGITMLAEIEQSLGNSAEVRRLETILLRAPELPINLDPERIDRAYVASGFMGDGGSCEFEIVSASTREFVRIGLRPGMSWGAVAWQDPPNNWGDRIGGFDLTRASRLTFELRGTRPDVAVKSGIGVDVPSEKPFRDSCLHEIEVDVSTTWQKYEIPLDGLDLSRVRNGFVLVLVGDGEPYAVDVDNIRYE